ncbi:MAG: alcohol dehydrogenase catalytic domain-containing protein [Hyphomonadaceae bacterium]|nr:alcohol dehydrogenase catalytic domain-containing protein [Hyphomonadaceae bacterium]
MRAAVFKETGRPLAVETLLPPKPGPRDLILKVRACGICGSDLHMTESGTMMPLLSGAVMGHEFSGEVVEVGSALAGSWKEGARVAGFPYLCCGDASPCVNVGYGAAACGKGMPIGLGQSHGAYAEFVRVSASGAFRLPDVVSFEEGALVEPLAVGLHAVDKGRVQRGETVLIIGAGPVGLAVALWAKFSGARDVIVSERAPARIAMAQRFGATDVVDPGQPLATQVEKIAGKGPDVIFECVGNAGMLNEAMLAAPRRARLVVAGVCQGMDSIMPLVGIMKELNVQFVLGYTAQEFDFVIEMLARDRIEAAHMITDRITLDALPEAFEALRRPSTQCKVMVEF